MVAAATCDTPAAKAHRIKLRERGFSLLDFMNLKVLPDFQRLGGPFSWTAIYEFMAFWVLAGYRDNALAKPPTDENMSEMTKIKKTFNSRGEVISVFKHTLDYHHHFGIPFVYPNAGTAYCKICLSAGWQHQCRGGRSGKAWTQT